MVGAVALRLRRAVEAIGLATAGMCRMMFRKLASLGLTALLLTGSICVIGNVALPAAASARDDAKALKQAADLAGKTRKALGRGEWTKAIAAGEAMVALSGDDAGYRSLLGTAYLRGGRFASAERALSDSLILRPGDGGTALNLALAQIATGGWDKARDTLARHADAIPVADRGLALALAGDPAGAVDLLTQAVRSAEATPKTRQNLALAFALSGRWLEARALAGLDLAPADADRRIIEWAAFARPSSSSDQIATLLGVTPVADPGQPVAIALAASVPVAVVQPALPLDRFMPGRAEEAVETAALVAAPPAPPAPAAPVTPVTVSEPRVLPPAAKVIAAPAAYKVPARTAARQQARGKWVVQLGTFGNVAAARSGWLRAVRRYPRLAQHVPTGAGAASRGNSFYRLSVSGFTLASAASLCRGYRVRGGSCFVRSSAGDQVAQWAKARRVQLAAR